MLHDCGLPLIPARGVNVPHVSGLGGPQSVTAVHPQNQEEEVEQ